MPRRENLSSRLAWAAKTDPVSKTTQPRKKKSSEFKKKIKIYQLLLWRCAINLHLFSDLKIGEVDVLRLPPNVMGIFFMT